MKFKKFCISNVLFLFIINFSYNSYSSNILETITESYELINLLNNQKKEIELSFFDYSETSKKNIYDEDKDVDLLFPLYSSKDETFKKIKDLDSFFLKNNDLKYPKILNDLLSRYKNLLIFESKFEKIKKKYKDIYLGWSFQDSKRLFNDQIKLNKIFLFLKNSESLYEKITILLDIHMDSQFIFDKEENDLNQNLKNIVVLKKTIANIGFINFHQKKIIFSYKDLIDHKFLLSLREETKKDMDMSYKKKKYRDFLDFVFLSKENYKKQNKNTYNRYLIENIDILWSELEKNLLFGISFLEKQDEIQKTSFDEINQFFDKIKKEEKNIELQFSFLKKEINKIYFDHIQFIKDQQKQKKSLLSETNMIPYQSLEQYSELYHSLLAGDQYFETENLKKSIEMYKESIINLELIDKKIDKKLKENISLRIHYRLLWAFYRIGDFFELEKISKKILNQIQKVENKDIPELEKISSDITNVLSDFLFEMNNFDKIQQFVFNPEFEKFKEDLGLKIIKKFLIISDYKHSMILGLKLLEKPSLSQNRPFLVYFLAQAYKKQKKYHEYYIYLNQMWEFYTLESLWRKKFSKNKRIVFSMEELLSPAIRDYGLLLYKEANEKQDKTLFLKSAQVFKDLSKVEGLEKKPQWILYQAHCLYYANQYDLSIELYDIIKNTFVYSKNRELILSNKIYIYKSKKDLSKIIESLEEYNYFFPGLEKTVDINFIVADFFYEKKEYKKSLDIWQKILATKSASLIQRKKALGQIVNHQKENLKIESFLFLLKKILIEEHFQNHDSFKESLLSLLKEKALIYIDQLESQGDIENIAFFSMDLASFFSDEERKNFFYKKSAFSFAMIGRWTDSLKICEKFFLKTKDPDLHYLYAKSLEHNFLFSDAAVIYKKFSQTWPKHSKSKEGLIKSVELSHVDKIIDQDLFEKKRKLLFSAPYPIIPSDLGKLDIK